MPVPLAELPQQADDWQKLVNEMADEDDDVTEYIRNLEERDDEIDRRCARRPGTRSPGSSSATCAAATRAGRRARRAGTTVDPARAGC